MKTKKRSTKEKDFLIPDYSVIFDEKKGKKNKKDEKFIAKIYKRNISVFLLVCLFYAVMSLPVYITPLITAEIIDIATFAVANGLSYELKRALFTYSVILAVCILQNVPSTKLKWRVASTMQRKMNAGIRSALVRKLQSLSITYHKDMLSGKIQSKFIKDTETLNGATSMFINGVLNHLVCAIIAVIIAIVKNGYVSLFFLVAVPLNVLLTFAFRNRIRKSHKEMRVKAEEMSAKMTSMIELMPVTKSHGLEDVEIKNVEGAIKKVEIAGLKADKIFAGYGAWLFVVNHLFSTACLIFCAILAINKVISVGEIVLYQTLFTQLSSYVNNIVASSPHINAGREAMTSLSEVMRATDVEPNLKTGEIVNDIGDIEFRNVSYVYPGTDKEVIKNFSFKIKKGECIGVVGSSGSGKTTLMNILIGFLRPTSGEVYIDGEPMSKFNISSYRQKISVVAQNSILFSGTVEENVTYGLEKYTKEQLAKAIDTANVSEFLGDLKDGINTDIGEHGDKLSGGQRQRVTIARALIREPKIIIFDEATSALDNLSEFQVQKAISSSMQGRTTFIVAHRLSTIRDADRIIVLEDGEMIENGTYDQLLDKRGKFYELKSLSDLNNKKAFDSLK